MFYHGMIKVNQFSFNNFKMATKPINPNRLSIYYFNDTHGNSDQMAGVINSAKQFKLDSMNKSSVNFIFSAGDNYSGGNVKKNSFIVDLMQNIMGVEASAVGNHEIDAGSEGFVEATKGKNINFVATNVILDDNNPMKDVIKKSIIKEQKGIKYGIIGTMPIDFEKCTKKEVQKDLRVMNLNDTIQSLQNEINNLKSQGIDKIILLAHTGYDVDKEIAKNLDGLDIIVGGHTHTVVEGAQHGENIVTSKSGEPVLIVQAGENGKFYGIIDAEFDENGVLKSVGNNIIESKTKSKSPVIEHIKSQKLGVSPKVGSISSIDPMPANRRIAHCPWTSTMADSMKNELGGDIALINSANIRKVPQRGILTETDIQESAPMKNNLIKTKVTQKQLVEAIKNSAKTTMDDAEGVPGLLHVSGLTYKIDDKGNLLELNYVAKDGKKTPIDINNPSENITYTAIYDSFIAQKDGEYPELFPQFSVQKYDFDKDKTMIDYLSKLKNKDNIEITDDKRIEIVPTSTDPQQDNNNQRFLSLTSPKAS